MAGEFSVGAIVSKLKLDKEGWDASVKAVQEDQKKMTAFAKKHGDAMKKAGKAMTIAGAAIVGSFGLMVKSAVSFNKEMANVATLIPGQTERIKELKKNVQDLAIKYGKSTTDISGGLYQVVSAFGDASDTARKLEINVRAAAAGMATTTDAINLTSAVTKGYGDVTADAVQETADMAFVTVKLGQTTFPELAAAIGRVVPNAAKLKVSQEELFAVMSTLTGVTGNANEVSTQFAGILRGMMKPTETMAKTIEQLGFNSAETMIAELGLVGSLRKLMATTDGTAKGAAKLYMRTEALTAIFALTGKQADTFDGKLEAMRDTSGALDEAFDEISIGINEAGFNMERLKQVTVVLGQRLGDKLAPTIGKVALEVGKIINSISDWTEKHPVLTGVILKLVGALGGLMAVFGPLLMILPGIIAGLGAMSAGLLAALGPIAAVVAAVTVAVAIFTSFKKKLKEVAEGSGMLGDASERLWDKINKIAEIAGISQSELQKLTYKYQGNNNALLRAISTGKESKELQEASIEVGKKNVTTLDKQTASILGLGGSLKSGLTPAMKKIVDLSKTMSDELKQMTLDEFEYRVEKAQELFDEREKLLVAGEASAAEHALNKQVLDAELDKIEAEKLKKKKEAAAKFWKALVEKENEFLEFKKEVQDQIDERNMSTFELALKNAEEERDFKLKTLEEKYGGSVLYDELKRALEEEFSATKKKLLQEREEDEGEFRKRVAEAEEKFLEAKKTAWHNAFNNIANTINNVLNMIGRMFQDLLNIRLNQIAKEETAKLDAINKQYDAQISASRKLLEAEQRKTAEMIDLINEEYDAKKKWIEENIKDEEAKKKALEQLEKDRQAALTGMRTKRASEEKAAADALLALEEAKNEAVRLASEELEKKRSDARRKAAKQEKAVALLSAVVNTAAGIAKVFASVGPPASFILAAITLAAGLVQIALIKSQPLPLAKGAIVKEPTEALIGEAGPEAVIPIDRLLKAIANKPIGFVSEGGAGQQRSILSPASSGRDINITIENNYNISPEVAQSPQTLIEMFDRNTDEMTDKIKKSLDRYQ